MTAYNYLSLPQLGSLVNFHSKEVGSFAAEAVIEFGLPVKRGTNKQNQVLPWANAIDIPVLGIALFAQNMTGNYQISETVSVLQKGKVIVTTALNVVAGEKAYVTAASGLFTNVAADNLLVGTFTSTGTGAVELAIDLNN